MWMLMGISHEGIADELGCCRSYVSRRYREHGLSVGDSPGARQHAYKIRARRAERYLAIALIVVIEQDERRVIDKLVSEAKAAEERRRTRPHSVKWCPCCGQRGGVCDEHRERLARIRLEFDIDAAAHRNGRASIGDRSEGQYDELELV